MSDGPKPHVGGPILPPCEPKVLIGFQPAARVTDKCTCVGPPDVIAKGSPTVLVGYLMAARIGDLTLHGGVITVGCPTVVIGEVGMGVPPGAPLPGHTIRFEGTPEQIAVFVTWLNQVRSTPSGRQMLTDIDNSGRQLTLKHDAASRATSGETVPGTGTAADFTAASNGTGVDTTILMDTTIPNHGSSWVYDSAGNQIEFTAPQNLAHELSHARHTTNGTLDMSDPEGQAIREENVFRQDEYALPPGVVGPPPPAPQRHGHAGAPRP
jgi:uncharacterized Zn-binding protein involved in type VI secretion